MVPLVHEWNCREKCWVLKVYSQISEPGPSSTARRLLHRGTQSTEDPASATTSSARASSHLDASAIVHHRRRPTHTHPDRRIPPHLEHDGCQAWNHVPPAARFGLVRKLTCLQAGYIVGRSPNQLRCAAMNRLIMNSALSHNSHLLMSRFVHTMFHRVFLHVV